MFVSKKKYEAAVRRAEYAEQAWLAVGDRLNALRTNAFITNARGHRIRYINATREQREKAEGGWQ